MEAHSFRRKYERTLKGLKRFSKVTLLSLVFFCIFFGNIAPTFAQTANGQYADYANLFSGTSPAPSLTVYTLFKQGTTTPDLKFNLQASFSVDSAQAAEDKEAAWDHIIDQSKSSYLFIIRICDVADTTEANCYFSKIPYGNDQTADGASASAEVTGTTSKIYHYQYNNGSLDSLQNDKFNVLFPVTEVAQLSTTPGGGLGETVPTDKLITVGNTAQYKTDAWYCAQSFKGEGLPAADDPGDTTHRQFNNLCGNNLPFFKIASGTIPPIPKSPQEAQGQTPTTIAQVNTTPTIDDIPSCGVFHGSVLGCVAQIAYYLIYRPIAWFAGLLGELFDFFLGYSLSDASYRADFAVRGWQIVRDISNVFFIIILVWVGLSTVFKTNSNLKRVVPNLILNALIINFSLFATRVVIDISNVVARVFYHSVYVCTGPCQKDSNGVITNLAPGIGGFTPLSEKIVSGFNPQKIFSAQVLNTATALPDSGTGTQTQKTLSTGSNEYAGYFIIVSLIAAFIVFAIAMLFWKTAFFFLGRVIGLYIAMIFAPFAFLSRGNIPLVSGIKELSWDNWLGDLTKYAMLAPIFVFFLYIIYSLLGSDFITAFTLKTGTNFFETVLYVAIPMLIVYVMIKEGVKLAENYAGAIGGGLQKWVDKTIGGVGGVVGGGVGLAAGGAAFVGRNTLGRGVRAFTNNTDTGKKWQKWAGANADNNFFARLNNQFINKTQTGSFDARNLGVKIGNKEYTAGATFNKGIGFLGAKPVDKISGKINLGQEKALGKGGKPGGVKKLGEEREKRNAEKKSKRINYSHLSDSQAKEVWEAKKAEAIKKYGQQHWEEGIDSIGALKGSKEKFNAAEKELAEARKTGGATATDNLRISRAQTQLANAKKDFEDAKNTIINGIRDGKLTETKAEAEGIAAKKEIERFDRYGTIKNVSGLEIAMRAEYAENLREGSFWLKDGKPRYMYAAIQGAAGAALMAALPGIGTIIGGIMLKNAADGLINNNKLGHVGDRATNRMINDAKKSQGRGNPERVLNDKLDDLKAKVTEAYNKANGTTKKYEEFTAAEAEDAILKQTADIEDEISELKVKMNKAKAEGREDDRKKHNYEIKQKQKLADVLDDALDNIERTQEKLDRMKDNKERKEKDADKDKKGKPEEKKEEAKPKTP